MRSFYQYLESQKASRFIPPIEDYHPEPKTKWIQNYSNSIADDEIPNIHTNYVNAMDRRRSGSALDFDSFYNYITRDDVHNFKVGDSYVFGGFQDDIFFPSHFSPKSLREGRKLIAKLQNFKVVLFVPDDLSKMAQSLGFIKVLSDVPATFRGAITFKDVLVSRKEIIPKLKEMYGNFIK